jgi:ribosome-associated heat shock protein Hsp15
MDQEHQGMRIDKWLWAARFFKTRSAAAQAIGGGKVHVNGDRIKPARLIRLGDRVEVSRGRQRMVVVVDALNTQRRPAKEAQGLYRETEASRLNREREAECRRQLKGPFPHRMHRPNKRERREIRRLTGKGGNP